MRAAGAIRTNLLDLLRYVDLYLHRGRVGRERIVSPASLAEMLRPHIEVHRGLYYGYGIAVRPDYHGHFVAAHSGDLKGVASEFMVVPRAGVAGAVLANVDGAPSGRILEEGINRLLGLDPRSRFADVPPPVGPATPLSEFGGWYCSGEGIWLHVTPRVRDLRLDFHGIELVGRRLKLRPHGTDTFTLRVRGWTAVVPFLRDRRGRVSAVHLGWRVVRRRDPRTLTQARRGRMVW